MMELAFLILASICGVAFIFAITLTLAAVTLGARRELHGLFRKGGPRG